MSQAGENIPGSRHPDYDDNGVNGRSDLPLHENVEYDIYYIQNYSPLLDLQILWKTIPVVLRGKGAY